MMIRIPGLNRISFSEVEPGTEAAFPQSDWIFRVAEAFFSLEEGRPESAKQNPRAAPILWTRLPTCQHSP
jgi:hypothetical protein